LQKIFRFSDFFPAENICAKIAVFLQEPRKPSSKPVDMNDDLSLVLEFFDRCGPEVEGRGLTVLEPEHAAKMERFIAGLCNQTECRELAQFLQLHPTWIRWIADRLKMTREGDGSPAVATA
jgi:hypothetical protein